MADEADVAAQLGPLPESQTAQCCYLTRLMVHDWEHIRILEMNEADRIGVAGERVTAYAEGDVYLIRRTLAEL